MKKKRYIIDTEGMNAFILDAKQGNKVVRAFRGLNAELEAEHWVLQFERGATNKNEKAGSSTIAKRFLGSVLGFLAKVPNLIQQQRREERIDD